MSGWLAVHLIGVVLFVGNIITAAFWKVRADLGQDPVIVHGTAKNVMLADYVFTLPGLALLVASGVTMAVQGGWPMSGLSWLSVSLILFAVTGVIWLAILIPLQRRMIRYSAESVTAGALTDAYRRASRYWAVFGIAATLLPVVILYLMVAKSF
ncbi:DUF2269 family protein [Paenibacillus aurantius]|uniref:DUF2269 family protein n=1 Tax=Paenibacillus aurantius TaxID=2918900 RepID=A0AA96RFI7_9BACL|nr:DUF2269 family protein [Paenibacillus aurantius]WNQ11293.1 DUF2269 family protein [Paenibacillus aurantius]